MKYKPATTLLLCFALSANVALAQEKKVASNIKKTMSAAREGKMAMPEDMLFQEGNIRHTLENTLPFTLDSNYMVRNQSYLIVSKAARASQNTAEILQCVEALGKGCHDKETGIALYCSKTLRNYPREHFSGQAKQSIAAALFPKSRTVPNIAQLIGYLGLQESAGRLQTIANDQTESKINRWYAHLALARMGNKASLDYCLGVYWGQETNSELVENMVPDLLYTRQKAAFDETIKLLYSNQKDCFSANPDNEKAILCGYLVMEQLAPYVQGFPLETHASGSIKGMGYGKALEELREWFERNKDYKIIDNRF